MAWTYEEVMATLGDEAQAVPGAIIVFRNKHIVVAETTTEHGFSVTAEGVAILEAAKPAPAPVDEPVKPAVKRSKKAADSANMSASVDDLDLG